MDVNNATVDMYVSKIGSDGVPAAIWNFESSTSSKNYFSDLHKFPDLTHLAVGGSFGGNLTIETESGTVVLHNPLSSDNSQHHTSNPQPAAPARLCIPPPARAPQWAS